MYQIAARRNECLGGGILSRNPPRCDSPPEAQILGFEKSRLEALAAARFDNRTAQEPLVVTLADGTVVRRN